MHHFTLLQTCPISQNSSNILLLLHIFPHFMVCAALCIFSTELTHQQFHRISKMECQHFFRGRLSRFTHISNPPRISQSITFKYILKHELRAFVLKIREQLATWHQICTNLELGTKLTARTGRTARAQGRRARAAAAARACA